MESNMKKLNITKKKFNESKYFQTKYGKLEYVSESGELYKTTKGKILKFKESSDTVICWGCEDEVPESDVEYIDGYPLCSNCRKGGMTEESSDDIANDPAYTCPYCGGHNCEFGDANPGETNGFFDGSTFDGYWVCLDCEKEYPVKFTMHVTKVG